MIRYLGDFLGGARAFQLCAPALESFKRTMSKIRVPLADEKVVGPTEVLVFLGLELQ